MTPALNPLLGTVKTKWKRRRGHFTEENIYVGVKT